MLLLEIMAQSEHHLPRLGLIVEANQSVVLEPMVTIKAETFSISHIYAPLVTALRTKLCQGWMILWIRDIEGRRCPRFGFYLFDWRLPRILP
jgi:hypothetical protein